MGGWTGLEACNHRIKEKLCLKMPGPGHVHLLLNSGGVTSNSFMDKLHGKPGQSGGVLPCHSHGDEKRRMGKYAVLPAGDLQSCRE
jgi:hypothetical protein